MGKRTNKQKRRARSTAPRKPQQAPKPKVYDPMPISDFERKRLERQFQRDARLRKGPVTKDKNPIRYRDGLSSKLYSPGKGKLS